MNALAWVNLIVFLAVLFVLAWPMSRWLSAVAQNRLPGWTARTERGLYKLAGVDAQKDMNWQQYALALLLFNFIGVMAVYMLQRFQGVLPSNPQAMPAITADSAFNTAVSFVTNTNWQGYGGESSMSYLTQMLALTVQNFLSAATGVAVVFAMIRGFASKQVATVGNFWADLVCITLWILSPLSLIFAVFLISQGVIQNFDAYRDVSTLPNASTQQLAMGPVASQEAIKMIGTNGGGFFNANSAHPFENPTATSNFAQMLAIFLIPAALCLSMGQMIGDARQGVAILAAMTLLFVVGVVVATAAEQAGNSVLVQYGVDQASSAMQAGGNMEGKESRFGIAASALFAVITTAASCGAVNAMHDSMTPLCGLVPLVMMQLGEVVFGGVGTGLYGMLIFAILAVFIAGLMIGRTPEFLGKRIESFEMKMVSIAILVTPLLVLTGTAVAVMTEAGRAGIANPGPHGFSEILYALSSAGNNNGSAFAGLSANTPFYNILLALVMWLGRFGVIVPVLALAGSLAAKKRIPVTSGTLPTHGPLFVTILIGVVLLVGLLNYVPSLALGPVIEHLLAWKR